MLITDEAAAAMLAHARDAAPGECCGLLIGDRDVIRAAFAAANIADDPMRRYTIDPHDHLAAVRAARLQALEIVGAYHSHPRSAAMPSATDAAEAFGDFLFVIVGLATEPPELTAWQWAGGNFNPVALVRFVKG